MDQDIHYHRQRASRELDLGLIAADIGSARAHLTLASLHFQQLRRLQGVGRERPLLTI